MYRKMEVVQEFKLSLREAWCGCVTPDDYEQHMAAIGQAQANAALVREATRQWAPAGEAVLIAGAGTGQMLDYEGHEFLAPFDVTFSDINPLFLLCIEQRLARTQLTAWRTAADDLECTQLKGPFALVVIVLVFEHIDWRKGVESIARLAPVRCVIVIQENPPGMTSAVSPSRVPPGTMKAIVEAGPILVDAEELIATMAARSYRQIERIRSEVADGKKMCAIVFERSSSRSA
jgi:hypothetical protein